MLGTEVGGSELSGVSETVMFWSGGGKLYWVGGVSVMTGGW